MVRANRQISQARLRPFSTPASHYRRKNRVTGPGQSGITLPIAKARQNSGRLPDKAPSRLAISGQRHRTRSQRGVSRLFGRHEGNRDLAPPGIRPARGRATPVTPRRATPVTPTRATVVCVWHGLLVGRGKRRATRKGNPRARQSDAVPPWSGAQIPLGSRPPFCRGILLSSSLFQSSARRHLHVRIWPLSHSRRVRRTGFGESPFKFSRIQ
jgi:hypothetical protein